MWSAGISPSLEMSGPRRNVVLGPSPRGHPSVAAQSPAQRRVLGFRAAARSPASWSTSAPSWSTSAPRRTRGLSLRGQLVRRVDGSRARRDLGAERNVSRTANAGRAARPGSRGQARRRRPGRPRRGSSVGQLASVNQVGETSAASGRSSSSAMVPAGAWRAAAAVGRSRPARRGAAGA